MCTLLKTIRNSITKYVYWPLRLSAERFILSIASKVFGLTFIRNWLLGRLTITRHKHSVSGSYVDNLITLKLTQIVAYAGRDVRAAWFVPGEPCTTRQDFENLARWAREHLELYRFWLPRLRDQSSILDLGGGIGNMASNLALWRPNSSVCVIDLHAPSIRLGKALFQNVSNLEFRAEDVRNLRSEELFDFCFLIEVLEHIPAHDHFQLLQTALSSVKPGGKVFVTTPNAINEPDDAYGHIGLLNLNRAEKLVAFFSSYITDFGYITNRELESNDLSRYSIKGDINRISEPHPEFSHFYLELERLVTESC